MSGSFWVAGSTGPRRPGVLTAEPTLAPSLVVQGALTAMTRRQPAADDAAGTSHVFEPSDDVSLRTVHGLADNGTPLTLLDAQNRRYDGFLPDDQVETLAGTHAVIGTHLAGRAHPFTAARARLQGLQALLTAEPGGPARAATRLADGSELAIERDQDGTWLVLDSTPAASMRLMDRAYLRPAASLLSLAVGRDAGLLALRVRSDDGAWCAVYSSAHRPDDLRLDGSSVLHARDLSVHNMAAWLDAADKLGPLPPVIVNALTGPIQLETRIVELATVCEGLHRRLAPDARRYPDDVAARIRDAAVTAAAQVHPDSKQVVAGFLSHIHEVAYGQRLLELADLTEALLPGVTGRTKKWRDAVHAARNDFAHRARDGWLSDGDVDRYVTVALSLRWVLHVLLLGQAGLPADLLGKRFAAHVPYRLFLQQAATWQPSIYGPRAAYASR